MKSIEQTIAELESILDECAANDDRAGYFCALYLTVTQAVQERCARREFDDPARMERFVSAFAERYISARRGWCAGQSVSASWAMAFEHAAMRQPLIVQHLALGISAHINLDLGLTVAEFARDPAVDRGALRADFDAINDVLGSLVERCENAVCTASPWLGLGDRLARQFDEHMVAATLVVARRQAWDLSERLARREAADFDDGVASADRTTCRFGECLVRSNLWTRFVVWIVRRHERRSPRQVIELLRAA